MARGRINQTEAVSSSAMEPRLELMLPSRAQPAPIGVIRDTLTVTVEAGFSKSSLSPALAIQSGPILSIVTLGSFGIFSGQLALRYGRKTPRRPLELLKALIAFGGKNVPKYHLVEALWPEADGDAALQAFKVTLHRLRRLLGAASISQYDGCISLNPEHNRIDCWDFERLLEKAAHICDPESVTELLQQAIRIYRGPFLEGVEEPWAIGPRERLRGRLLRLIAGHTQRLHDGGWCDQAIELLQQAIEVDDLSEEYYRRLMQCHAKLGRLAEALAVYHRCRETLGRVLGLRPGAEMEMLYQRIRYSASASACTPGSAEPDRVCR